ncbi:MAG: YidC/Oxa1 family membrane protein insertase [Candidatus Paceibacterota bacterium]
MNFITLAFDAILYTPMLNILIWLYGLIGNFGVAIIILTLLIKVVLHPLNKKSIESQKAMAEIQPKMQEIQNKYKDNKEKQATELVNLYKQEKFNPFAGIILLFLQIPILIALFYVVSNGMDLSKIGSMLYPFVQLPQAIYPYLVNLNGFELLDLSKPNIYLAVITAAAQFWQIKTATPPAPVKTTKSNDNVADISNMMQKQMVFFVPLLTFIVLFRLPAALGLYWVVSTIISVFEQKQLLNKKK